MKLSMELKTDSSVSWVNTEKLESGIYLIELICNEKELGVCKVVIE